ncbi:MAG: uL13 family ribosomal protein, partial [Myxococcales bacterium]|nr:uL13 family ribosomal protein [Myxococcales bacterium]
MATSYPKPADIQRKWWVIDLQGATLGRAASQIATLLRGKHKPIFTPHLDTGDFVVV